MDVKESNQVGNNYFVEEKANMNTDKNEYNIDDAEEYSIEVDDEPNIKFRGWLIAKSNYYITNYWRGIVYRLYKTLGGKFVCQESIWSCHENERDGENAKVCKTKDEVIEFFGLNDSVKNIYRKAGIEYEKTVS